MPVIVQLAQIQASEASDRISRKFHDCRPSPGLTRRRARPLLQAERVMLLVSTGLFLRSPDSRRTAVGMLILGSHRDVALWYETRPGRGSRSVCVIGFASRCINGYHRAAGSQKRRTHTVRSRRDCPRIINLRVIGAYNTELMIELTQEELDLVAGGAGSASFTLTNTASGTTATVAGTLT
jgi:hypothetical protein